MTQFRKLFGEEYVSYELTHDCLMPVIEVLEQLALRLHRSGDDLSGRYIASLVSTMNLNDESLFNTAIILGG